MPFDISSIRRKAEPKNPRIIIYGDSGLGKTTFGASAPEPIFILTEDGMGTVSAPHYPVATTLDDVMSELVTLYNEKNDFKTVVIDSLDWLEPLVWAEVCRLNKVESIEKMPYGRGYTEALIVWLRIFDGFTALRDARNMIVVMIAHSQVIRIEDPTQPAFDSHGLKLHKRAAALAEEFADIIGFAALKTMAVSEESGFNSQRIRAKTTGERILHMDPSPAYVAKNRYGLPDRFPLHWPTFWDAYQDALNLSNT